MGIPARVLVAIIIGSLGIVYHRRSRAAKRLPPGPPGHFLFGNLKDLPKQRDWIAYAELSKKYESDIISLRALGNTIVVLNSHKSIVDLLEKRAIYADRPSAPMVADERLMNLGGLLTLTPYGPRWRQLRRGIQLNLQESAIPAYWPAQNTAARNLMIKLLDHGDRSLYKDLQHWSASSILSGVYGYHLPEDGTSDPLLQHMHELVVMFVRGSSLNFLVNFLPALKYIPDWMPGANFKAVARQARELKRLAIDGPFEWVKNEIAKGTAEPSYVSRSLAEGDFGDDEELDASKKEELMSFEDIIRHNAGVMYGAGFDTTLIVMTTFLIAMQLYPEVQARAREEVLSTLDPVTRLPVPSAVVRLAYLSRVLKESFRWIPVLPVSVPHATTQDDEYEGYTIPARSLILPNVWAVTRDESIYPDPETFEPDRFLDPSVPHDHAFGYGRRRCPGMHFANSNLMIAFAYILTVFEIEKGMNEDGTVIEPRPLMKKDPEL
ncbi:cytochrome P450 family protein [Ceratobasidium sp. AG-Ba]|nr:cytochrome P450 family protein [Ceratobasidium sp. AG-Ba]